MCLLPSSHIYTTPVHQIEARPVIWEVITNGTGGEPTGGSVITAGTNCGTWSVIARSTVDTNCSASATLNVVKVTSISPSSGLLVTNNPDTYLVPVCLGYLTVSAGFCPSMDETNLPGCWQMNGGLAYTNEDGSISRTKRLVDTSSVGTQTVTATAGCSSNSVKIIVYRAAIEIDADAGDCLLTQHAWWNLTIEPSDAYPFVKKADGTDLTPWLGEGGYYGEDSDAGCIFPGCEGRVELGPQPITGTTNYYSPTGLYWWCISFENLINALTYTRDLWLDPGTYVIDSNSCVTQANAVGGAAGVTTGYSGWNACDFSGWLQIMYATSPPICGCP
jgi:hypothetical protein